MNDVAEDFLRIKGSLKLLFIVLKAISQAMHHHALSFSNTLKVKPCLVQLEKECKQEGGGHVVKGKEDPKSDFFFFLSLAHIYRPKLMSCLAHSPKNNISFVYRDPDNEYYF